MRSANATSVLCSPLKMVIFEATNTPTVLVFMVWLLRLIIDLLGAASLIFDTFMYKVRGKNYYRLLKIP